MHRKHQIPALIHAHLYPTPTPTDPPTFTAHLTKHLISEVRIETARFYGSLDTTEARYPGLDYSHPPHRARLSRFPHHARLFAAFDALRLTESEIANLCRWEGTLWARRRYERDEGVVVRDTTGAEIGPWVDRRGEGRGRRGGRGIEVVTDIEVEIEEAAAAADGREGEFEAEDGDQDMLDEESEEEGSEVGTESVGMALNQALLTAAAAREQDGSVGVVMDPEYEQYLKEEEAERGGGFQGDLSSAFRSRIAALVSPDDAAAAMAASMPPPPAPRVA